MEEREEKLNKAREKLDKFRKKKNKSSHQGAASAVVEDGQMNNFDSQSLGSSACSPVMFVPPSSSTDDGHQEDNFPSPDPAVQPSPSAPPQPISSSASSPFELMGDNLQQQQTSSNNEGLAAYFTSSSSNDAVSSLDGFTQIAFEGIILSVFQQIYSLQLFQQP